MAAPDGVAEQADHAGRHGHVREIEDILEDIGAEEVKMDEIDHGAVKLGASILFWVWLARTRSLTAALSLGLLVGGALGNALDRVLHGAVVDFIHLHFFGTDLFQYVFNLADVAVTAGVVGLLYDAVRSGHRAA